jgi:carbamoyl-phosphate synthase large subunit
VIVQYGGQTPLKLARALEAAGVPIIGTSPDAIDRAEDRERFQQMVQRLNLRQPPNATVRSEDEAIRAAADRLPAGGAPVLRAGRPRDGNRLREDELKRYLREAVQVSNDSPVLLDHFLNCAIEMDVDAVCDGKDVVIGAIMQHIEQAGVHSGDSACSLPPYSLPAHIQDEMREQVKKMALELGVVGLMNVQLALQGDRHLRDRSQPACLAYRAVRVQVHRRSLANDRRARHGRQNPERNRLHQGNHPELLQREGSGVPVRQIPWR